MLRHANRRTAASRFYKQQRNKPVLYLGPQRIFGSEPYLTNITRKKYNLI